MTPRSRGARRPKFDSNFRTSRERGRRECRVRAAPAVSCAKECGGAHEHTGQRRASDIPCAMVLRLMPSSPRRRIHLASVAGGLKDCSDPVGSTLLRLLDTSNGCRDHTVLPYAASPASPGGFAGRCRLRIQVHPDIGAGRLRAAFAHGR